MQMAEAKEGKIPIIVHGIYHKLNCSWIESYEKEATMKHQSSCSSLKCAIIVVLLFSSHMAFGQDSRSANNSLYLELLGNGGLYSLNYDRMLTNNVGVRLGVSRFGFDAATLDQDLDAHAKISVSTLTFMTNYLVGKGKHCLELGVGAMGVFASADVDGVGGVSGEGFSGTGTIGYRIQPLDGGFLFRVGFTPAYNKDGFSSWIGISLGAAF
jgi:hypothetical protein